MSATDGGAVYCTLLLSDHYLPGAVVLAHSLRDNGTKAKLIVLYTPDTLQPATIHELQSVYDEVIPVQPTTNNTPANLWLMDRPDLIATFTKIELWRQTQYQRIVYIDCDVVALRAPDELLSLEVDFAAAPDVGWPDCFNSGVMVLRPNLQDYFALKALAERGISFDGADQGLLNMHFRDWHRLSFTYNCTPSANYQYIPAYKHFQSTISLIHFIGAQKPWIMARQAYPTEAPYNQLLGRWWAIYDRHYRPVKVVTSTSVHTSSSGSVTPRIEFHGPQDEPAPVSPYMPHVEPTPQHQFTETFHEPHSQVSPYVPQEHTTSTHEVSSGHDEHGQHHYQEPQSSYDPGVHSHDPGISHVSQQPSFEEHHAHEHTPEPIVSAVPQYVRGEEHVTTYIAQPTGAPAFTPHVQQFEEQRAEQSVHSGLPPQVQKHTYEQPAEPILPSERHDPPPPQKPEPEIFQAPRVEWDASREPPPLNTMPEGIALEKKTYNMSDDRQLFQPPQSYPEAPKNMYYQVPETKPEPKKLTQIFPWESHAPKPTRVFLEDEQSSPSATSTVPSTGSAHTTDLTQSARSLTSWSSEEPPAPTFTWDTYSRSNAWDEVPEIQKYIQSIQKPRKAKVQVISSSSSSGQHQDHHTQELEPTNPTPVRSHRLTDFPSEEERPSLPVTPAPIRRGRTTHQDDDNDEDDATDQLPVAEGVPNQEDWNPAAQLEELRRRQSEVLDHPELLHERILQASLEGKRRGSYDS